MIRSPLQSRVARVWGIVGASVLVTGAVSAGACASGGDGVGGSGGSALNVTTSSAAVSPTTTTGTSPATTSGFPATTTDVTTTDATTDASSSASSGGAGGVPNTSASTTVTTTSVTNSSSTSSSVSSTSVSSTSVSSTSVSSSVTSTGSGAVFPACSSDANCNSGEECAGITADFGSGTNPNSIYPSGICGTFDQTCSLGDGTTIEGCDNNNGVCLDVGLANGDGECIPACSFDNSGAAPVGCPGKDLCNVYGWGSDASGPFGIGFCFGGCAKDTDCSGVSGQVCDTIFAECVDPVNKTVTSKALGATCTEGTTACDCAVGNVSTSGVCTRTCIVGGTACGAGLTCDPQLPASGTVIFSAIPDGIGGSCFKTCVAQANCPAGTTCTQSAGLSSKTCQPTFQ